METRKEHQKRLVAVVVLLAIGIFLVVISAYSAYVMIKNNDRENPTATLGIYVTTSYGNPDNNTPGFISYSVWGRYGQKRVTVMDDAFDGTLDKVVTDNGSENRWIDSNSPDWDQWVEIYHQIRTEVTTGKLL